MDQRIILVGKAASGKDYFKDYLTRTGYMPSVSHTSRPIRDGEEDGKTYNFVTERDFVEMIADDKFKEHKEFNGWYYGTTNDSYAKSDVFIFTPSGVKSLDSEFKKTSIIVYFDIPLINRLDRLQMRSDKDSVERRIEADEKDFLPFREWDIRVTDPMFNPKNLLNMIEMYSKV